MEELASESVKPQLWEKIEIMMMKVIVQGK
jgi:hypothetical protein